MPDAAPPLPSSPRGRSDVPFILGLGILGGLYVLLIAGMLVAELGPKRADAL